MVHQAEPGADYYVLVQVLKDSAHEQLGGDKELDHEGRVYVEVSVDGKDLGYYATLDCNDEPEKFGTFDASGLYNIEGALRFESPRLNGNDNLSVSATEKRKLMGNVTVHFSEAKWVRCNERKAFKSEKIQPSNDAFHTSGNGKKDLRTCQRSYTETEIILDNFEHEYERGEHLETVVLHYCTTRGLIDAGILPQAAPVDPRNPRGPQEGALTFDLTADDDDSEGERDNPINHMDVDSEEGDNDDMQLETNDNEDCWESDESESEMDDDEPEYVPDTDGEDEDVDFDEDDYEEL